MAKRALYESRQHICVPEVGHCYPKTDENVKAGLPTRIALPDDVAAAIGGDLTRVGDAPDLPIADKQVTKTKTA